LSFREELGLPEVVSVPAALSLAEIRVECEKQPHSWHSVALFALRFNLTRILPQSD
jgi:hypothetical protein